MRPDCAVVRGMPEADYHAHPATSQSTLKAGRLPTMAHARWELDNRVEKAAWLLGTCVHGLILEGRKLWAVEPPGDGRKTEVKEARKRFAADPENAGKIILSEDDERKVLGMRDGLLRHSGCRKILDASPDRELSIFWTDENGHKLKGRIDVVSALGGLDVKTTRSAEPWDWSGILGELGYHIQAAMYLDAMTAAGLPDENFGFMPVENFGSFEAALRWLDHESIRKGKAELELLKIKYFNCVETGIWPGYPEEETIGLRPWRMRQENEGEY